MTYGGSKMNNSDMNAHKAMAGAGSSGNFGIKPLPQRDATHPDLGMKHDAMDDGMRSPAVKGGEGRMMQGSPDHGMGKGVKDHFDRAGKV